MCSLLMQGLQNYAAGEPQPWGAPASGQYQSSPRGKTMAPVAFLACAATESEPPRLSPRMAHDGPAGGGEDGGSPRRCRGMQLDGGRGRGRGAAVVGCFGEFSFEGGSSGAAGGSSSSSGGDCVAGRWQQQQGSCASVSGGNAQSMDVVDVVDSSL